MLINTQQLALMIADVLLLHQKFPPRFKSTCNGVHDNTPSELDLTTMAVLLLCEKKLPEKVRVTGVDALLAHSLFGLDIFETQLPKWCSDNGVESSAKQLYFGRKDRFSFEFWDPRSRDDVSLFALYDTVIDLTSTGDTDNACQMERVREHLDWVKNRYPRLAITMIAEGLLSK